MSSPFGCWQESRYAKACSGLICQSTAAQKSMRVLYSSSYLGQQKPFLLPDQSAWRWIFFIQVNNAIIIMGWLNYRRGWKKTLYISWKQDPHTRDLYDKALACQAAQIAAVAARGVSGGEYTDRKTSLHKAGKWRAYSFGLQRVPNGHD